MFHLEFCSSEVRISDSKSDYCFVNVRLAVYVIICSKREADV